MDHTQGLRNGHPSFILSQSIQSLEDSLYLALPQQLLREFLCVAVTLSSRQNICNSALTESPLLDLLCSQSKHRKHFDHDLDDDIDHYRGGRDRHMDLETV
jgi:hypothetical protein